MRTLYIVQLLLTAFAIGWVWHRQSAEHSHATAAGSVAVHAYERAVETTHAQAQLDADLTSAWGDLEARWRDQLGKLCSTLAVLVRMTEGRATLPADGRAVCPGIEKLTSGALNRTGRER